MNRINYTNKIENKDRGQYNHGAHKLWTFSSNENNNCVINGKNVLFFQKEMVVSLGVLSMGIQIIMLKIN